MAKRFIGSVDGTDKGRVEFEFTNAAEADDPFLKRDVSRGAVFSFRTPSLNYGTGETVHINPNNFAWWAIVDDKDHNIPMA